MEKEITAKNHQKFNKWQHFKSYSSTQSYSTIFFLTAIGMASRLFILSISKGEQWTPFSFHAVPHSS